MAFAGFLLVIFIPVKQACLNGVLLLAPGLHPYVVTTTMISNAGRSGATAEVKAYILHKR